MANMFDQKQRDGSLLERKRRQWAQEKAEQQEWYPFGRPGAGAPLKSPLEMAQQEKASVAKSDDPSLRTGQVVTSVAEAAVNYSTAMSQMNGVVGLGAAGDQGVRLVPVAYNNYCSEAGQLYVTPPTHQPAAMAPAHFPQANGAVNVMAPPAVPYAAYPGSTLPCAAAAASQLHPDVYHPYAYCRPVQNHATAPMAMGHGYTYGAPCRPAMFVGKAYQASPYVYEPDQACSSTSPQQGVSTAYVTPIVMNQRQPFGSPNGNIISQSMYVSSAGSSLLSVKSDPISKSCDSNIHKRRTVATAPKDDRELEEHRLRVLQQKRIFDEQIHEKQLKAMQQAEMERREMERIERERREIEYRQAMENELERNKWKRMKELEEMRQNDVVDSWKKAKEEAEMLKHARLRKHAALPQQEDEFVLVPGFKRDTSGQQQDADGQYSSISGQEAQSTDRTASSADFGRSPSLIPAAAASSSAENDRPIKPMEQSPVEMWDNLISRQLAGKRGSKREPREGKKAPADQTMALNRSKSDLVSSVAPAVTPKTRTSIVRPLLRHKKEKAEEGSPSRTLGLGERLCKKLSFKSSKESSPSSNGSVSTGSPVHRSKLAASNLINHLSSSLHIRPKMKDVAVSTAPLPRKDRESLFVPENPFGDSFGGVNPLCQPLQTRGRKSKRGAAGAATTVPQVHMSSPSSSSTVSMENGGQVPALTRSPSVRHTSASNFNSKSPLYQSISSKIRCSTENHKKMLEQLFQLRKQLKDKHKQIEEAIMNPVVNTKTTCSHGAAITATESNSGDDLQQSRL